MRMRSPQVSRSLGRTKTVMNVCCLGRNAIDSSMVSPITDTEGAAEHRSASVCRHGVDDENGDEPARTRRRHSPGTSHDHPGLARPTCEAVRRRRGRACVAPRLRCLSGGGWLDTIRPQCERLRSVSCVLWLSPRSTGHVRYRTCARVIVWPPHPSAGVGTGSIVDGAPWSVSGVVSSQCVCGSTSKLAQSRPRGGPWVPARYTLRVGTRREAAHG